jgi:hypothetical protein
MATLNGFVLLTATCRPHRERIVAFPWQQWSREHAMMLRYALDTYLVFFVWNDVWWWETPRHSVHRSSLELRGEQILALRRVKTCRLQKQSMIRHRNWFLEQLSVSGIFFLWIRFVIRFASSSYPSSHPDRTWDSVCRPLTSLTAA